MQTVWTEEVEQLATENMKRCTEIANCKAEITKWKQRLKKLQNEHRVKSQLAEVHRNPAHWNRLKKNEKFRKEYIEIVLKSYLVPGRERRPYQEIPSLLRDWKQVPAFLRSDPDLFSLRFRNLPPVDYFPIELIDDRKIVVMILQELPNLLSNVGASSPLWSDRDHYKLFLEHNDVTDPANNTILHKFHFDVRNDAGVILTLTQCDEAWQRLLKPSTGCFRDRTPGRLLWKNRKEVAIHILRQSNSLRYFSSRLRDDPDVVKVALERFGGQLLHASFRLRRNKAMVSIACQSYPAAILHALKRSKTRMSPREAVRVFESAGEHGSPHVASLCFKFWKDLPNSLQCNRSVALAACRHILPFAGEDLPACVTDRFFWEEVIERSPVSIMDEIPMSAVWNYDLIPKSFKNLGEVKSWRELSSFRVISSPTFWLAVARSGLLFIGHDSGSVSLPDFVFENKDIMLEACQRDGKTLSLLDTSPLAVDRDILEAAMENDPGSLRYMKDTAQLLHPDIVAGAMRRINERDDLWDIFDYIDEDIWIHKEVALAWLEAGGDYLTDEFDEEFEDDEEVFLSVAKNCPQDFWYASEDLCRNKDFMLRVVEINPILLKEASSSLERDFDLSLIAFGLSTELPGVFDANNRDDFDFLTSFAAKVRGKLLLHRSFFALLMGMERGSMSQLSSLNQDAETSTGLKKNIASFLDVPKGDILHSLRCASLHLAQWGF